MRDLLNKQIRRLGARALLAGAMILLAWFCPAPASAQPLPDTQTIVSFGESRIYSDVTSAKKAAVSEALLNTIQTAASRLVPEADMRRRFELIARVIHKQRDNFIQEYRILKEFDTDKHYWVLVEATISLKQIKEAFTSAGLQTTPDQLPSVLLMIAEKNIHDLGFTYWWQPGYSGFSGTIADSVTRQAFSQKGFELVSPDPDNPVLNEAGFAVDLDAEPADYQAAILGKRLGADLVVVGRAEAEPMSNRMGEKIRTFRGGIQLHVIRAETGEKMTTISKQVLTVSEDPEKGSQNALADASYKAATQLSDRIVSLWQDASEAEGKFMIRVQGDRILPHLERLRAAIKEQPGVSGLRTTEMASDKATLAVDYKGTSQELANHLLMKSFDRFGINIMEISEEALEIELIPR